MFEFLNISLSKGKKNPAGFLLASAVMATDGSTSRSASPRSSSEGAFPRSPREEEEDDEKEALKWAAHEKLPSLGLQERQRLIDKLVKVTDVDNEKFMLKLRYRFDRLFSFISSFSR